MAARVLAALVLVLLGSLLAVPIAILLGTVALLLEVVHAAWARSGLEGVRYRRALGARHVAFGDELPLAIEVWNRRRLPLAWVRADDDASPGVEVRERDLVTDEAKPAVLRNAWTLRPYERVVRRFHVTADRRGVHTLGPVELSVGDPFARRAAAEERDVVDTFLVWPRVVPTTELAPTDRWGDLDRAHQGLAEDPSRFAGVRPYAPGDPVRRVHARTSARLDRPMLKRFEPSRDREVLVALDVQTSDGPAWDLGLTDDEVEGLYVVAASVVRQLARRKVAFGFMAAGYTGAETRIATVPVAAADGQAERILDLLARLSAHASMPFERLLGVAARRARPGTTVLVLTARDPRPFATALRRLELRGAHVVVVGCGRRASEGAARARALGFTARQARLDDHWRTAERLVIAP
ncbi:MAG TPA: DUF58 domain-containing protein [Candidatus Limnocylindrales bacterium]|nr:DUF58 domain-containing protein [Candidatus Limnocylindrales bacterium]